MYHVIRTPLQNSVNLIIIGFVSSSVQLLLIREIMNIAGGYELITGTFLGSWLIGSAVGVAMAKQHSFFSLRKINILFASGPLITVLLLIIFERLFLNPGETPSYFLSIIITLLALLPFCFISGFTFIKLIDYSQKCSGYKAGKSFSIETTGAIIAGITVTLLTAGFLNTYQLLLLIVILNTCYVLVSFFYSRKPYVLITMCIMAVLVFLILVFNPDIFFRQQLLHGIKVTDTHDTPYGNITQAEYNGEKSYYYNQRLLSWPNDEAEREENIHYAMLQHNQPENVLIISGDIKSNIKELSKYHVKKVVYIERDPALIKSSIQNDDPLFESVREICADAFRFIKNTNEYFDVVILLLPPPSTLFINRYYTTEFFEAVKKRIGPKGIFACSPGSAENYYSKESVILYSSIFNSLSAVFGNVRPIAGNKLYFISSDAEISSAICSLSEKWKISNLYVSSNYLSDDILGKKSEEVLSVINTGVRQNTLGFPVACFHYQSYNLSKNLETKVPAIILLGLIFVLPMFAVKRRNLMMFSSAAALSGFEIIILLMLQTIIGNMYLLTGLVIASLMSGLAFGSGINLKKRRTEKVVIVMLLLFFYFCTGLIFKNIPISENYFISLSLLLLIIFIPASLTGRLFSVMTTANDSFSNPASVYNADLAGSALGFILISGVAIPALGIRLTIILLSAIIFAALLFGTIRNK
jgi:spermidine synthase